MFCRWEASHRDCPAGRLVPRKLLRAQIGDAGWGVDVRADLICRSTRLPEVAVRSVADRAPGCFARCATGCRQEFRGSADIAGSTHEFPGDGWNPTEEFCVACHTPHNDDATLSASPSWMRVGRPAKLETRVALEWHGSCTGHSAGTPLVYSLRLRTRARSRNGHRERTPQCPLLAVGLARGVSKRGD